MSTERHEPSPPPALTPFFIIWTGQAFSLLGSELVQFALVWYLTTSTGSATVLTFASLVAMLPKIFLGPVVGALVDRWNRRVVMIAADSLIALVTAGLAALFALNLVQVWHIYVLLFVRALGGTFHYPAMTASTTLMVPEKHLSRIQGLNSALSGLMGILAPALGALSLNLLPMMGILAIDVGTALLAILPLCFVFIPQPEVATVGEGASTLGAGRLRRGVALRAGLARASDNHWHPGADLPADGASLLAATPAGDRASGRRRTATGLAGSRRREWDNCWGTAAECVGRFQATGGHDVTGDAPEWCGLGGTRRDSSQWLCHSCWRSVLQCGNELYHARLGYGLGTGHHPARDARTGLWPNSGYRAGDDADWPGHSGAGVRYSRRTALVRARWTGYGHDGLGFVLHTSPHAD
jgi:hypothetical protein